MYMPTMKITSSETASSQNGIPGMFCTIMSAMAAQMGGHAASALEQYALGQEQRKRKKMNGLIDHRRHQHPGLRGLPSCLQLLKIH